LFVIFCLSSFWNYLSLKQRSSWQQHVFSMCLKQKSEGFGGSFILEIFINHDCAS
jgi:hypothetical protein